jgi:hypothetical protein
MACADLPLEIAQNNLTHCYYLGLHCRTDGEVRVAAEEAPSDESYQCPLCQTLCHCTPLGEGGTLRPLPFWNGPKMPTRSRKYRDGSGSISRTADYEPASGVN